MLHALNDLGLFNITFWCIGAFLLLRIVGVRRIPPRISQAALVAVGFASLALFSWAAYRAYAVPRDILQDIVAADEFLAGRPMHSENMGPMMVAALDREGERPSLFFFSEDLRERERLQRTDALTSHWVQAHPPAMTLFTAPFVRLFGILGTQVAFLILSLLSLGGMLWLLRRELASHMGLQSRLAATLLLLAWDPLLAVLRCGQIGLVMCGLLTLSWYLLRHDRPISAGIAAGLAISLKLIPGVILVVLLMRHRRAFASAAVTIGLIFLGVWAAASGQDYLDYIEISRGVVDEYAAFPTNTSLLGLLARGSRSLQSDLATAKSLWLVCGACIGLGMMLLLRGPSPFLRREGEPEVDKNLTPSPFPGRGGEPEVNDARNSTDLEFALAMSLMPLLSPVAWDHYLTFLIFPLAILAQRVALKPSHASILALLSLLFCLAIPDTTYIWLNDRLRSMDLAGVGVWFVLLFRTLLLLTVAGWVVSRIRQEESAHHPRYSSPTPHATETIAARPAVPGLLRGADVGASAT